MIIQLKALDPLFFRDGKPFARGSDTYAAGIFPPPPSVLYGALRSAYFARHIHDLPKANDEGDPTSSLKIKQIMLKIGDDFFLPAPLDCVKKKENMEKKAYPLRLGKVEAVASSYAAPHTLLPETDEVVESPEGAWFDIQTMKGYLTRQEREYCYISLMDYITMESKTGIMRNRATGGARENMIYSFGMTRLQASGQEPVSLVMDFEGLELPSFGLLKLGKEGRAVSYAEIDGPGPVGLPAVGKRFKVYLTTPAFFEHGWLPGWLDRNTFRGSRGGADVQLLAAAVGRFLSLGGFDMKKKKPKAMRRAVPAGSVYYFEVLNGDADAALRTFHQAPFTDYEEKQGFGLCYVGAVL
ncbi:type III-B CRISPR module-associated protein Cmr3 [Dethiobacter alkaliphilus]|uniref:type III-B CRISPR module-associated protein Cmr3 n=1 Tax=Dethiobacter alkaliphilus TaxID=427926 RepID=UPI002226759B|nr:type III-B CRISPR module-associated protein Cmr3 [Dethiobacter alkaliphilus]MCW3488686.1 type III-B CRISPR module-associated protein Cmr3 [Dethiobacter alkaliphilus]